MTVRFSLYNDGSNNLQEFTAAQNTTNQSQAIYQYSTAPSVTLTVDSSNSIGTRADTRLLAGAATSHPSSFQTPTDTTTNTINFTNISQTIGTPGAVTDTNNVLYPVYYDGTNVVSMNQTDFLDTFILPSILTMVQTTSTGADQAGTYTISTGTSLSDHTNISGTPIYTDTRADSDAYTEGGVPETLDQPQTVNNYYLHRRNGSNNIGSCTVPMFSDTGGDLRPYTNAEWQTLLKNQILHTAVSVNGYKIRYVTDTTSTYYRGTGMADTKRSGQIQRNRLINTDDYRSQFMPADGLTTINTYYLRPYLA